jgi:hypothetical protein
MIDLPNVPVPAPIPTITPTEDQQVALDKIEVWSQEPGAELALTGYAGTGKTSIMRLTSKFVDPRTISWTAMTGKAATRLRAAAGVEATTLHSVFYDPPGEGKLCQECRDKMAAGDYLAICKKCFANKERTLSFDTIKDPPNLKLVVDEASMMTPSVYRDIQVWRSMGVSVLYVGDGYQLPPVMSKEEEKEHGKDFTVFAQVPGPTLTRVMRNGDDILDAATMLRTQGRLPMESRGGYEIRRTGTCDKDAIASYLEDRDDHILITWTNQTRMLANLEIRRRLGIHDRQPQPGEPILIRRNGPGGVVLNGEIYRVATIDPGPKLGIVPTVQITTECGKPIFAHALTWDGSMPYIKDYDAWKSYKAAVRRLAQDKYGRERGVVHEPLPITYGYVLTAHAAQGGEARRVTVFLPRRDTQVSYWTQSTPLPDGTKAMFSARFLYTSLTRAKQRASILLGT